jgi:hypothetical protein
MPSKEVDMKPLTIGFFATLAGGAYFVAFNPGLWFPVMVAALWSGLAMVQGDVIDVLVKRIQQKDALLELAKITLTAADKALDAVTEFKKEDA